MLNFVKFLIFTFSLVSAKNNVCPSYLDYLTINFNPKCWYDPDVDATIPGIINNHGYKSELHNVTTWDGYIIGVFRIPSKLNEIANGRKTPLILFPGLNFDARCWLMLGEDSPAIYYSKKGYDVWIANQRGTEYSSHVKYTKNDGEFWNYSFHEVGTIDVPAIVEKVAEVSEQPGNIIYIGHSMGTTASYVYCSLNTTHCAKNLKALISLAPVANLNNVNVPFFHLLSFFRNQIKFGLNSLGVYRFEVGWMFRIAFTPIINPRIMPMFTAQGYAPISVKTIAHYGQIINNKGNFTQYDWGMLGNLKRYHFLEPPKYNLEDIPVNVTLIYGNKDKLAYKTDVEDLYSNLHPNRRSIIEIPRNGTAESWAHLDFIIGANITTVMYPEIDDVLDKMN